MSMTTLFFTQLFQGHHRANEILEDSPFEPNFSNLDMFLNGVGKLSQSEASSLTVSISKEEVEKVIKEAPTNKSPGFEGLSYEFYWKQKDLLVPILTDVFNAQLNLLKIAPSNQMGATRLISKVPDNITPTFEELCPITLLCVDYKLLKKVLTSRLVKILPSVIKSPQSCCVKGRNICSAACNILSSIEFINKNNIPAAILSADMFKAYDRVNLSY